MAMVGHQKVTAAAQESVDPEAEEEKEKIRELEHELGLTELGDESTGMKIYII